MKVCSGRKKIFLIGKNSKNSIWYELYTSFTIRELEIDPYLVYIPL